MVIGPDLIRVISVWEQTGKPELRDLRLESGGKSRGSGSPLFPPNIRKGEIKEQRTYCSIVEDSYPLIFRYYWAAAASK